MLLNRHRIAFMSGSLLLAFVIPFTACKKSGNPEKPSITAFASPDDAGNALLTAAKSGDQNALLAIFGSDSKELLASGDPVQEKNAKKGIRSRLRSDAPLAKYDGRRSGPAGRSG